MALEARTLNAKRNIAWGAASKVVLMLLPFFIRTIFIYTIGLEYLGLSSLYTSLLQILSLAELGFATAVVYSLYKPLAENDTEMVCAIMAFLKYTYYCVGVLILVLGLTASAFLPHFIHGDVPDDINIYYLFYIYLLNTVISYFFAGYKSALLTANQRDDIKSKVITVVNIAQYVLQGIVLLLFKDFYLYVTVLPLATLSINALNAYFTKRYFPQYVAKGTLSQEQVRPMIKQIGGLFISRICAVSRNSVTNILISSFIGLLTLAVYSNYVYVETSIQGMLTIVGASILAGVGNSIVKESEEKNYSDFKKFNFIYMWISGWCFCCLVNLFQPFITLWVGEKSTMQYSTVLLLCLVFYFTTAGDMRNTYINATGIWWQNRWRPILEASTNLLLSFLLIKQFQVSGVLVATLISLVFVNLWFGSRVLYSEYFKTQKFSDFIKAHLTYFIISCLAAFLTYLCCSLVKSGSLLGLLLRLVFCMIIPNVVYFVFYYRKNEFKESVQFIKRFVVRNKA